MKYSLILTGVSLAVLAGCATITTGTGRLEHLTQAEAKKDLVKGVTTEAQVKRLYGGPTTTEFASHGDLEWIYTSAKDKPDAKEFIPFAGAWLGRDHVMTKTLVILFNQDHVVQHYSLTTAVTTVKMGG